LIPFVGPYFDYQIGTTQTWDWTSDRFLLSVLPGAAAVLGGLIMLYSTRRATASFGGLLALAGGLWFVAGPSVSMLWNDGVSATGAAIGDTGTRVLEWIGFHYGTGGLITLFSAYGLGFLAVEYASGSIFRRALGKAPWDYTYAKHHVNGLIRPDYFFLWALAGLLAERLHDELTAQ
jgi:hypothetical protein